MKIRNIVIVMSSLLLIGGWFVLPLVNTTEGESQGDRPQMRTDSTMRQQARADSMQTGLRDPNETQKKMSDRMENEPALTDQEWVTIEALEKVMVLSNEVNSRGTKARGRRPGQLADPDEQQSELQKASIALREVMQKADSTPQEVSLKLAAFRAAKETAKQELAAAQGELKKVLNAHQEARLVQVGLLN